MIQKNVSYNVSLETYNTKLTFVAHEQSSFKTVNFNI